STDVYITITRTGTIADITDHTPMVLIPWAGVPGSTWDGTWGDASFTNNSRVLAQVSQYVPPTVIRGGLLPMRAITVDNGIGGGGTTTQPVDEKHTIDVVEHDLLGTTIAHAHVVSASVHDETIDVAWSSNLWPSGPITSTYAGALFGSSNSSSS